MNIISYEESESDNVVPEEIPVQRIELRNSDQQKPAEPGTVTSQINMIEIEGLMIVTHQHPVCASTLDDCPVEAAASCEEDVFKVVIMSCKATQDASSDAKNTGNEPAGAASQGENVALDIIYLSTPNRDKPRLM